MEQFVYYLKVSFKGIKRAPLPYALTIFILSVGLGVFLNQAGSYRLFARGTKQKGLGAAAPR